MRPSISTLVLTLVAACTTGSGRDDHGVASLAAAACQHARECGCDSVEIAETDGVSCETTLLDNWWFLSDPQFLPPELTMVFDTRCLDQAVEILRDAECDADLSDFWFELPCPLYHGTGNVGDVCEPLEPLFSWCLPDLVCVAGRCEPGHVTEPGNLFPGAGEACTPNLECSASAWCDSSGMDGPICRALGDVGDACTGHRQCVTQYCPAGACDERPGPDEPCGASDLCADGLVCDEGTCRELASCLPSTF